MATTFKNFLSNDLANTRTLLHEAIPITGSIVSGTYGGAGVALGSETNIKTYGHGIFESVYDYPYLSSSANQIFDVTVGIASNSSVSASTTTQNAKKINIYNQMAQYLVGYDTTGSIKKFKLPTNSKEMRDCYFIPFSRLLIKDEIKKGSFTLDMSVSGTTTFTQTKATNYFVHRIKLTDTSGSNGYYVDSPVGEYGVLFASTSAGTLALLQGETLGNAKTNPAVGLLYYQAGIAVISASVFSQAQNEENGALAGAVYPNHASIIRTSNAATAVDASTVGFHLAATGATIAQLADGFRNRIYNISYNNTTELNSTIYFCRAGHSDFNYSSNPTYLTGSSIRVKTRAADTPISYITTVGLYSADNELLAVAKLSEPLRKDPTNEITLRVRLDF